MSDVAFRAPRADDWPAILSLAELSLGEIPIVPSQLEWLNNRKSFSPSEGIQHHFVATSSERIVGYACIEHRNEAALTASTDCGWSSHLPHGKRSGADCSQDSANACSASMHAARGWWNIKLTPASSLISKRWDS
jgi:hypothetical protein